MLLCYCRFFSLSLLLSLFHAFQHGQLRPRAPRATWQAERLAIANAGSRVAHDAGLARVDGASGCSLCVNVCW